MVQHPTGKPPSIPDPAPDHGAPSREGGRDDRPRPLEANDVIAFLGRNPDFLAARPELLALLTTPTRDLGGGVIDLQRFMIDRLRVETARLKLAQRKLIATSRNNLASQGRVHGAVLALIAATSFEHLIAIVTDELTFLLDIDAVGLCVEAGRAAAGLSGAAAGVQVLEPGTIDRLLGERTVLLRGDIAGDPMLFGMSAASLVRSDALVRLSVSRYAPLGLLALGARRRSGFNPAQGTELLMFLARVIEQSIRAWLDLPE